MSLDDVDLPDGWKTVTTGDIAEVVGGGTPKTTVTGNFIEESGHPWITPADLTGYSEKFISRGRRDLTDQGLATSSAKYMPAGTVLYSSRAPIGYVAIAANPVTTNQGFRSFVPSPEVDSEYLYYALKLARPEAEQLASGTTFAELSGTNAKKLHVALAPLATQRRIVRLLDAAEVSSASAASHLASARLAIQRFRQAVLASACSGRLTSDWRADVGHDDGSLPAGWRMTSLDELASSVRGGTTEVPTIDPTEFPVLRSSSVRPFNVDLDDVKYLQESQSAREANYLREGDLLFTRLSGSIEYVGNCALVKSLGGRRVQYPDRLFSCRLAEPRRAKFIEIAFASQQIRSQIEAASKSAAGHQRISISDLKRFTFGCPPLAEQDVIVSRVEALLATADEVARKIERAATRVGRTSHATIAKAFKGEFPGTE